jgi:hypothetical protein
MALITKDGRYIRLAPNIEGNILKVHYIFYMNENDRKKEKEYLPKQIELVSKIEQKIEELYQSMLTVANRIGYTEEDYRDRDSIIAYAKKWPEFNNALQEYNNLYYANYNLKNYINDLEESLVEDFNIIEKYFGNNARDIIINCKVEKIEGVQEEEIGEFDNINITQYAYNRIKSRKCFGNTEDI